MIRDPAPPPLTIVTARADDIRADVLVRAGGGDGSRGTLRPRLTGTLTGPRRGRDTTLPTSVPLVTVDGTAGWSRATCTEPAYWTPEMPNLYRLEARLVDDGRTYADYDLLVGLRRLGVRGRSFRLDGRRWVPRGVSMAAQTFDPGTLRSLVAAAEVRDPDAGLLAAADAAGVAIVARLEDSSGRPLEEAAAVGRIAGWALHPSAMIAVVPRTMPVAVAAAIAGLPRVVRDTMLLAVEVDGTLCPDAEVDRLAASCDCLVVDLPEDGVPHDRWREWPGEKPLVARRRAVGDAGGAAARDGLPVARRRCDLLQAALAAWELAGGDGRPPRDWAGYLVAAW